MAAYGKPSAISQCLNIPNDEVWVVNLGLDMLLGFGRALDDIQPIVHRGPLGAWIARAPNLHGIGAVKITRTKKRAKFD